VRYPTLNRRSRLVEVILSNMRISYGGMLALTIGLVSLAAPIYAEFVCVGEPNSISVYQVREDGALVAVGSPYPVPGGARSVAVDPVGRVVYMLSGHAIGSVTALSIDEKGGLTPIPGSPFATESQPTNLAIDVLGRFLYVPTHGAEGPGEPEPVDGFSIGTNGALRPVPGSPFPNNGTNGCAVAVDPVSRSAYLTNLVSGNVTVYGIGSNGALASHAQVPAGLLAYSLVVDIRGRFLYVANSDGPRSISGFTIGANGLLTEIAESPFANGSVSADISPSSIAIDPQEQFVFVANSGSNNLAVYSIGTKGALTPVVGSPFTGGGSSAAVDLSGRFLYVAESNSVAAYRISEKGSLKPVEVSPFAVPSGASSIAVSP
jgi:6-phosphogluconolactonase (cycloisomerase 2 family)